MKTLTTERLTLREMLLDDADDFFEYAKNPSVSFMVNREPHLTKEASYKFLKLYIEQNDVWAIELKENHKVIGHLKMYPDVNRGKFSERNTAKLITYALSEDYWNRGYMTEAVKRAVEYAFDEMGSELLTAFHIPQNIRSKRVIEKCGFQYETTIKLGYQYFDGQTFDSVCHCILKSEWEMRR
jgi:Acetyltransferases, including N-acetylases of ribosomal proteins